VQEPSDYWAIFERRLTELGAQPILIGALAAQEYRAAPRLTTDVDFLVRSLDGIAAAFRADGYDVREMAEPGSESPYVVFIRGHDAKVDALLVETPYQSEAHRRASNGLLTIEDVIVHKLIAWRAKDQDDIESILSTRPTLDEPYIERWADEWQVVARWTESKQRWMAR
jgi:hypothetical protein